MNHVWTDSEGVLRSRKIERALGVRCAACSVGKLHTEGNGLSSSSVYHPAGRECDSLPADLGTVQP